MSEDNGLTITLEDSKQFLKAITDNQDKYLTFLSENTRRQLGRLFDIKCENIPSCEEEVNDCVGCKEKVKKAFSDTKILPELWKTILMDSIHFLRLNDSREKMFLQDNNIIDDKDKYRRSNKTKMTEEAGKAASKNAYGINELHEYFKEFTSFESLLYGSEKYYRDHLLHPLKVWIIGLHILKDCEDKFSLRTAKNIEIVKEEFANPEWEQYSSSVTDENIKISSAEFKAMWTIAALTHDLGYPLEKVGKINDKLEKMLAKFGHVGFTKSSFTFQAQHDHLVTFLLKLISSIVSPEENTGINATTKWGTHLRPKYLTKFSKSWEMFDHGIVSSLILLRSLTFFIESEISTEPTPSLDTEDARQFAVRSEILHAIAAHTTPKVYHIMANTLPFLLVLCDDLQEWGRPTFSDISKGNLLGSYVKTVKINKCNIDHKKCIIDCHVKYMHLPFEEQRENAKRIFINWHERLRPAVDDKNRNMNFKWEIEFEDSTWPAWTFTLNPDAETFKEILFEGPSSDKAIEATEQPLYSH